MTSIQSIAPRRETVAGTTLLRRPGNGMSEAVVLLHGIGSNAQSWQRMLEVLDPDIDAIAWDAPGYGASSPLANPWPHPADYAARLDAVLDGLDMPRVILVGHSLGALFAACFAASRPERVLALALFSPALGYRTPSGQPLPETVQARIDDLDRLGAEAFAENRSARLVYRPEMQPEVLADVRRAMATVHPAGYAQAVRALGAGDLLADATAIAAPTVVAVGAQDVVTPPPGAHAVFVALRHGQDFQELPDVGHALPQQAPQAAAALIEQLAIEAGRTA